ncbi:ATP-binding protein [Pedobacter nyackensis]|nr:ATP-binding protein [Pedobacter nyackensis]
MLNFLKFGVILPEYIADGKIELIAGCTFAILITLFVIKILLSRPGYLAHLMHFVLVLNIAFMWSKMLSPNYSLNLITIQNVFMICMWSFYGLSNRWGIFYSIVAIGTVSVGMFIHNTDTLSLGLPDVSMAASVVIIVLNTTIILLGHYFYRNAIYNTIEEKEKLNDELAESNEAKILFLSTMSHELRTPLNSVIGITNLLIEDSKEKEQNEHLDILKFSAESLLTLINDILDFNKMGSGKVELESISFNLKALLANACAGLSIKAVEKGLYCTLTIDPELDDQHIIGDPTRLLQIIYNLVGNAIKFTQKGGVQLKVKLLQRDDNLLLLRFVVRDSGLGISAEQQHHIFEPFVQASRNTTRKYGGTGLGLSIVKHLLTLHNSEVHVESKINAGAKFYFDIFYQTGLADKGIVQLSGDNDPVDISGLRVLLAEDNMMSILFMKKLFSKWNVSLTVAEHGQEVLDIINENDFDVVLMDIHMPVLNGYETTRKLRALQDKSKADVYIVALTASLSREIELAVTEVGMNDMISKPFQTNELLHKLKQIKVGRLETSNLFLPQKSHV